MNYSLDSIFRLAARRVQLDGPDSKLFTRAPKIGGSRTYM